VAFSFSFGQLEISRKERFFNHFSIVFFEESPMCVKNVLTQFFEGPTREKLLAKLATFEKFQ